MPDSASLEPLRLAMSEHVLLDALRSQWSYARRRQLEVTRCNVQRVHPRRSGEFGLEYRVELWDGRRHLTQDLLGELVGPRARDRHAQTVRSLAKSRRGQLRKGPTDLVDCIESLGLVLRTRGLDERLPGLGLLQPERRQELSELVGGPPNLLTTELLGHRLGKRATARIHIHRSSRRPDSTVLKMYKNHGTRGRDVFETLGQLRAVATGALDVPVPIEWFEPWRVLRMEDAPGRPLADLTGQDRVRGAFAAGRAIASLHETELALDARHCAADELMLLTRWVALVSALEPQLGERLEPLRRAIGARLMATTDTTKPRLVHRDFYDQQVLVHDSGCTLVDFDTLCYADPALDVGNFLAHEILDRLKRPNLRSPQHAVSSPFLEGYEESRPALDSDAVRTWTDASLLRLVCLYSFWPRYAHLPAGLLLQLERRQG